VRIDPDLRFVGLAALASSIASGADQPAASSRLASTVRRPRPARSRPRSRGRRRRRDGVFLRPVRRGADATGKDPAGDAAVRVAPELEAERALRLAPDGDRAAEAEARNLRRDRVGRRDLRQGVAPRQPKLFLVPSAGNDEIAVCVEVLLLVMRKAGGGRPLSYSVQTVKAAWPASSKATCGSLAVPPPPIGRGVVGTAGWSWA
jgi:hypothetical protein